MSRIAKNPITLPKGVELSVNGLNIQVKGPKGTLTMDLHPTVEMSQADGQLHFKPVTEADMPMAGTMRALVSNMVTGVSDGFEKRLALVGVGYRASVQGKKLNLQLGFSHPVDHEIPDGVSVECPSQTEIVISGSDKQKVGQVAAEVRLSSNRALQGQSC